MGFSSARVKISQIVHVSFELTSQFLFEFFIILHCHDTSFPCKFWAHKFSTLHKRVPSKFQFLNFQTCSGENLLNSSCHFESTSQFSFKCCINFQCHQAKLPYNFFSSTIIYFVRKKPIKVQTFEIFECLSKFVKFFMSILNWHVSSSSNFASLFNVSKQNSPVSFKLMHFLLWIKWSHQSPNF